MYSSAGLHIFTLLCNQSPEFFLLPRTETLYPLNNDSISIVLQLPFSPWWASILLSMSLIALNTSHQGSHIVFDFLCWLHLYMMSSRFIPYWTCVSLPSFRLNNNRLHTVVKLLNRCVSLCKPMTEARQASSSSTIYLPEFAQVDVHCMYVPYLFSSPMDI